jgi:hypothetical protein
MHKAVAAVAKAPPVSVTVEGEGRPPHHLAAPIVGSRLAIATWTRPRRYVYVHSGTANCTVLAPLSAAPLVCCPSCLLVLLSAGPLANCTVLALLFLAHCFPSF